MKRILPDAKHLITGRPVYTRGYPSSRARRIAIAQLKKRGFNYFTCYKDTQAEYALIASWAAWAMNSPYVCR